MKFSKNIFLLVLILIISCKKNSKHLSIEKTIQPTIKIAVDKSEKKTSIEDIIEIKEIIPLDLKSGFSFKKIDKIKNYRDNFFVFDNEQDVLCVFNKDGLFITNIGSKGRGPAEYADISDFAIDQKNELILLLSVVNKSIYEYDFDGNHIRTVKLPFQAQLLCLSNENQFLSFYLGYFNKDNVNLIITDRNVDKTISTGFDFPENIQSFDLSNFTGNLKTNSDGFLYTDAISSIVHQVFSDGDSFPKYEIEFSSPHYDESEKYNFWDFFYKMAKGELNYLSGSYEENKNALVFSYNKVKTTEKESVINMHNAYYVKSSNTLYTSENITPSFLNSVLSSPLGLSYKNEFISIIDPANGKYMEVKNGKIDTGIKLLNDALVNKNVRDNYIMILYKI